MISVLVVDDSQFFRQRLCQVLAKASDIKVVATASNGREAVDMALSLRPDFITMDYEMPVMDGITAVRQIREQMAVPILMVSSLTYEGARVTLNALEAGASDFIVKSQLGATGEGLVQKIRALTAANRGRPVAAPAATVSPVGGTPRPVALPTMPAGQAGVVAIGASTGGPVAIKQVLERLPRHFPWPVLIVQHMPAKFTRAFADRLNDQCAIVVKEAEDGEVLQAGVAYIAPGGRQMLIEGRSPSRIRVCDDSDQRLYRPSVDVTFGSAAKAFGNRILAVVLTGMGDDGTRGAKLLKNAGAMIWVQDAESCVVNGMPQAIRNAQLADEVVPIGDIGQRLARLQ